MKIGELVNFKSTFKAFQRDYSHRNPGVVLEVRKSVGTKTTRLIDSATVMWANGDVTSEHAQYLHPVPLP